MLILGWQLSAIQFGNSLLYAGFRLEIQRRKCFGNFLQTDGRNLDGTEFIPIFAALVAFNSQV